MPTQLTLGDEDCGGSSQRMELCRHTQVISLTSSNSTSLSMNLNFFRPLYSNHGRVLMNMKTLNLTSHSFHHCTQHQAGTRLHHNHFIASTDISQCQHLGECIISHVAKEKRIMYSFFAKQSVLF